MRAARFFSILAIAFWPPAGFGQSAPAFLGPTMDANAEVRLELAGRTGTNYRIDGGTNAVSWEALASFAGQSANTYVDSGAPFFSSRFYRAVEIEPGGLTGDHIATTEGDAIIHPVNHASFLMSWNGLTIYNDPVGGGARYRDFAKANLILVSHSHGDHYDNSTLIAVREADGVIVVPPSIYGGLPTSLRTNAISLANGASTNILGLRIDAIPAYNSNHPKGSGNGYILTLGGKRIYISGDTGDIPEMRALREIDVAFLAMNVPYTMTVNAAASAAREFQPRIVYPYHYRNADNSYANFTTLRQLIGRDLRIEVRTRNWY